MNIADNSKKTLDSLASICSDDSIVRTPNLVIGGGIAGLMLAIKLAAKQKVLVIAKGGLFDNNTFYAQGGIASVLGDSDSFDQHIQDTLIAGADLCRKDIVELVVKNGPKLVKELIDIGVKFTSDETNGAGYHLTREGGHSHRRVIHAADLTGQEVILALVKRATEDPNITIVTNQMAIDLITTDKYSPRFSRNLCLGGYVLDKTKDEIFQIRSANTYLCTGGHGKAYLYTSNPDSATGDGLAMGWRAGCKVANLEFMQFHPTCLFDPKAKTFLISEAVRGEGGVLKDANGKEFMNSYHPSASLAPRDIVARAIDTELKSTGATNVFLDIRQLGVEKISGLFPNIFHTCQEYGIDITKEMIPVVPAAHYSCGGLVVDSYGQTAVGNLYAIGECACTGLHGANRLASNSLLEGLVFADRVSEFVLDCGETKIRDVEIPKWDVGAAVPSDELVVLAHTWDEIRRLMWHYVGIVRSNKRLKRALNRIVALRQELDDYYWNYKITESLLEVRNLAQVAWLSIRCAMARKESRGIHYTIDDPTTDDKFSKKDTILAK